MWWAAVMKLRLASFLYIGVSPFAQSDFPGYKCLSTPYKLQSLVVGRSVMSVATSDPGAKPSVRSFQ